MDEKIIVRNPGAIRPWQHVLEPLYGYLLLAEKLHSYGCKYAGGWNFGPADEDAKPVEWIVEYMCAKWGEGASYAVDGGNHPHEAQYLKLDCSKARTDLRWQPRMNLEQALCSILEWTNGYRLGKDLRNVCRSQIEQYAGIWNS